MGQFCVIHLKLKILLQLWPGVTLGNENMSQQNVL